ncbi:MAG: hypothetical protein RIK87_04410 [Fuerstiella sp.]
MQLFRPGTALHLFNRLPAALLVLLAAIGPAAADEPFADFVEGLRQRQYFDTALEYLDQLAQRTDLPQEFADTLDLERGITYREMGTALRVPEDREQALSQAEQALKKFTEQHGNHPRAAFANFELGQLLLERARTILWDSDSPSNADRRSELQQQARAMVEQAKAIYQKAHDQYDAQHKAFPTFIDRNDNEELYLEREAVFYKYLRAWYNLARCTYERGQTFDRGTQEHTETLIRASEEFAEISAAYRTTPIGRLAYLMQGKCFQEQDDISRALGLYNTILDDKSEHPTMMQLKAFALQFRLICLNHEKKKDYQLVINEATEWTQNRLNRQRLYSEQGLGIQWEKAIAEEELAKDRTIEAAQRTTLLRQALADARQVARFPSPYREPAVAMTRRINAELGEKDAEPEDFDTAFERGRGMISQMKGLQEELDNATTGAEKQKARQAIDLQLNEIGRMFELALELRESDSDPKAVAQARYLLSYVYLRQRKSFDAIILAQYCMTKDRLNDPDTALSATEIAIEAGVQAFNDAGEDQSFELDLLKDICEMIVSQYPQSARGNEARIRLGQVYRDLNDPLNAAQTYLTVPPEYSEYPSARMQAGQSWWLAWVTTMSDIEAGTEAEVDEATLQKWKQDAAALLQEGVNAARQKLGEDARPTAEMAAAEVSLATILNMDGKYPETIQRLTGGGEHSVLSLLNVADGESRPEKGIQSAAFAGQTYRLLLRAYVGTQQIDEALQTMNRLEAVGGQDTAAVYTQLGRELQEELQRLKAGGEEERLTQVRQSFEQFLQKVYDNRDQSDYNSLLWIGETYYSLGQGVDDDPVAAPAYYQKANQAYQEILTNNLADAAAIPAIKLRVIRCKRAQKQYDEGISIAQEVLDQNPLSLDVQFEAAYTLAAWGADENSGAPDKLLASIDGLENAEGVKTLWGWAGITRKLQARQGSPDWADLKERFLEARYEYIRSRYRYALTGAPDGEKQLKSGLAEVTIFAQVFNDLDDAWFAKFDRLYQDIQTELGQVPVALERPEAPEIPPEELASTGGTTDDTAESEAATTQQAQAPPPPAGSNLIMVTLAVALAAGGGYAFYRLMSRPPQRRRSFGPAAGSFTPPPSDGGQASGEIDFGSAGTAAVAAPPRKKVATRAIPPGQAGAKKKRVLTPEEAARYKAAKAAKAKAAAAAQSRESGTSEASEAPRKTPRKTPPGDPSGKSGGSAAARPVKKVRRPPPPAPPEQT